MATPLPDFVIDEPLVKHLLSTQCPQWSSLPLQLVDSGWDNTLYRLGEDFLVRMPRRKVAIPLLHKEQHWLPQIAPALPDFFQLPVPLWCGQATAIYPAPWSIVPWVSGQAADLEAPKAEQILRLIEFLQALHQPAPSTAPLNPHRGVPLVEKSKLVAARLQSLRQQKVVISPKIEHIWAEALAAPVQENTYWLHGDLHPRNIIVRRGKITSIIDWGDLCAGDPATDLAILWMLVANSDTREQAMEHYGMDSALLARARAWALYFGLVLLDSGLRDHPRHARMGQVTLERLEQEV